MYPDILIIVDNPLPVLVLGFNPSFTTNTTVTSVRNSTQGSTVERRFQPATTNNADTINAATTNDNKGFGYVVADMATVDSSCLAFLAAQVVRVNLSLNLIGTGTGDVGANDVYTPRASLWKYNPSTDSATLIAGASGSPITQSAAIAYSGVTAQATVDITVPDTTFTSAEILMLVSGGSLACGAGLLGGARTFSVRMRHNINTTNITHQTIGLRQACSLSNDLIGEGVISRGELNLTMEDSLIGEGVISSSKVTVASKTTDLIGEGVLSSSKITTASKSFDMVGEGVSSRESLLVDIPRSLVAEGEVAYTKIVLANKSFYLTAEGAVTLLREIALDRSIISEGNIAYAKATTIQKIFNLIAEGVIGARVEIDYRDIPDGGPGPTSPTLIFAILD